MIDLCVMKEIYLTITFLFADTDPALVLSWIPVELAWSGAALAQESLNQFQVVKVCNENIEPVALLQPIYS